MRYMIQNDKIGKPMTQDDMYEKCDKYDKHDKQHTG
jgi:hypothetical protein